MEAKTPIENLNEALDELVEVYPTASRIQRNLLDSLFKVTTTQLNPTKLYYFVNDRIIPIKNGIKEAINAEDNTITEKLGRILTSIIKYFNDFIGTLPPPPISPKKKKIPSKNPLIPEKDIQKVDTLKKIFGDAKCKIEAKKAGTQKKQQEQKQHEVQKQQQAQKQLASSIDKDDELNDEFKSTIVLGSLIIRYITTSFGDQSDYMSRPNRKPWSCVGFKIDNSRLKARDTLIASANVLWSALNKVKNNKYAKEVIQNLKTIMIYLATTEQTHHVNTSGTTFFRNFTTCEFTKTVNAILAKIKKAEEDVEFRNNECNDNNLWKNEKPSYNCRCNCRCGGSCGYREVLRTIENTNSNLDSLRI